MDRRPPPHGEQTHTLAPHAFEHTCIHTRTRAQINVDTHTHTQISSKLRRCMAGARLRCVCVCSGPEEIFSMCQMNPRGSPPFLIGWPPRCVCFHSYGAVTASYHPVRAVNHAGFQPSTINHRPSDHADNGGRAEIFTSKLEY